MGAMVLVKFGGGCIAGAAWVLTDLCLSPLNVRVLASRWIRLGTGFLIVTLVWVLLVYATLPAAVAGDTVFPAYMVQNYQTVPFSLRWPVWHNRGYFIGAQMVPLLCAVLFLVTLFVVLRRGRPEKIEGEKAGDAGAFLFLGFYFLLAFFFYFKQVWLIISGFWLLGLAAAWIFSRLPLAARTAFLLFCLPAACLMVKSAVSVDAPGLVALDFGPAGKLWADPASAARVSKIREVVDALRAQRPQAPAVMAFNVNGGWSHFCGWPVPTRHGWLQPGFLRPADEPALLDSFDRTAALIVADYPPDQLPFTGDPTSWQPKLATVFPPPLLNALQRRLAPPIRIDDTAWVFPLRPAR
jgi:hypothetical protein